MKAILCYDASEAVRAIVDSVDRSVLDISILCPADSSSLGDSLKDVEVLLHVLDPVTAAIMRAAPKLRLVQKIGVGVDAIDLKFAKSRSIAVCNAPGTNSAAVVEFTLGLMFACLRRITQIDGDLKKELIWPARAKYRDQSSEIGQRCIGLIGFGEIARRLAPVLQALGAAVIVHSPSSIAKTSKDGVEFVSFDDLIGRADIISLHAPLKLETRGLINAKTIARMKRGSIIINTARGQMIDESSLVDALRSGHLSAAGLDVFEQEPIRAENPLLKLESVVTTPHIAWMTDGTWRRSMFIVEENVRRLASGSSLLHQVVIEDDQL